MSESIGQQLRLARQERNLTLAQVARGTHIRLHYLEALEAGDFSRLPSKAHARGFIRAYAGFLDLDAERLLRSLNGETPTPQAVELEPTADSQRPPMAQDAAVAQVFAEIGGKLSQQRETLGLSLEDVVRHTHLRQHYLVALESGNLEGLPSPVQGRGMLSNYATFLGLDPDPLLLKFADGLQARLAAQQAAHPKPKRVARRSPSRLARFRRWFSSDILLGGILVLSLAGFVIWGAIRINAMRVAPEPAGTVPSIAEALQPTPEPVLSPTPSPSPEPTVEGLASGPAPTIVIVAQATEAGEEEPVETGPAETEQAGEAPGEETAEPAGSGGSVQVYLTVHQRAWVRITVDGEVAFEGRMLPGSAYSFDGNQQVEILTGNGAAIQVFYNQRDLGKLGIYGEVVNRIFTVEGEELPTPTITPTPSATSSASLTPGVTQTSPPSPAP